MAIGLGFSGNGAITAGNGVGLLANSNVIFAGNTTIRTNGARTAYFYTQLQITASDPANITVIAAANSTDAANISAGLGEKCVSGGIITISPGDVLASVNNGNFAGAGAVTYADAGNVYIGSTTNQTYSFKGY